MDPSGSTSPEKVFQKQDGFWFSYSPDGKYIAMVVADMANAVVSAARLAAKANGPNRVGEGVAPDAIASSSGSLHPATPRWLEILDASTFQVLHRLEGVAGLEEYFYWSPKGRYIVTWQPLSVPTASSSVVSQSSSSSSPAGDASQQMGNPATPSPTLSSNPQSNSPIVGQTSGSPAPELPNLKVWDVLTGKVVMHFKHAQRQGWPIVRWTDDEKIAARWASGQVHLYHWAKASFHLSPEENFANMYRESISKINVWDWSVARSALALFIRENAAEAQAAHVYLYPLNTTLGEEPSASSSQSSEDAKSTETTVGLSAKKASSQPSQASPHGKTKGQPNHGGKASHSPKGKGHTIPMTMAPPKEPNLGVPPSTTTSASSPSSGDAQSSSKSTSSSNPSNGQNTAGGGAKFNVATLTTMAPSDPIATKSFYNCDDVQFHWHNRGQALLVFASTQRDKSGQGMYYGNTYLYYLSSDGKGDCDLVTDKAGPIHDARWNVRGNDFAVTYGEYPSKTMLYNRKCKALGHLGTDSRNKLVWSPQGRVLMSGGFGQLPGNFDIWDTVSLSKLGSSQAFTSGHFEWSPDGKYLMTAALWPRMRVDNYYCIYDLSARTVLHSKQQELWKVSWRPMPGCASAYPTTPTDPIVVAKLPSWTTATAAPKSSAPYRPPHAKNAANSQFAQSQVPLQKEQRVAPERFAPPSNPNAKSTASSSSSSSSSFASPSAKTPIGGVPVKKTGPPGSQPRNKGGKKAGNN
jgi:uncharacterized protein with WD repeat